MRHIGQLTRNEYRADDHLCGMHLVPFVLCRCVGLHETSTWPCRTAFPVGAATAAAAGAAAGYPTKVEVSSAAAGRRHHRPP